MKKKTFKRIFYTFFTCVIFSVLFLIFSNLHIINSTEKQNFSDINKVPKKDIALVLGTTAKLKNGWTNYYFTHRMNAVLKLYKQGKIKHILVSGDNSRKSYNEPEDMLNTLVANGVPANKITLDYAGFRTLDSVVRAKKIFGAKSIIIVSQKFHNQRALYLANHHDIDAIAYNAKDVSAKFGLKTKVREYFAKAKAVLDIIIGKSPKFLGKKEFIRI